MRMRREKIRRADGVLIRMVSALLAPCAPGTEVEAFYMHTCGEWPGPNWPHGPTFPLPLCGEVSGG